MTVGTNNYDNVRSVSVKSVDTVSNFFMEV